MDIGMQIGWSSSLSFINKYIILGSCKKMNRIIGRDYLTDHWSKIINYQLPIPISVKPRTQWSNYTNPYY